MTFFELKTTSFIKLKGAKKMNKWKQKTERYYTGDKKKRDKKKEREKIG